MAEHIAIITGAGGGIGRATAIELSRRGYSTVLVGRTEKTLRQTEKLVMNGLVLRADVTKPAQAEGIVRKTLRRFGRIDCVVNNAGIAPLLSIEKTTVEAWRQVIDTNLSAAFFLSRAVWPTFKKQKSGVVVNISSMAAKDPFPGFLAYGAAKAGLNNFSLSLAREGASIGVQVHCIAPGAVETPMLRKILSQKQLSSDNTLTPAEVAKVVARCVTGDSPSASGEVIWLSKDR